MLLWFLFCPLDYLVLSHPLPLSQRIWTSPGMEATLPLSAPPSALCPHLSANAPCLPRVSWGVQSKDTFSLRLEHPGPAPDLFLGQQVQPITDTKIHSQGKGRQANQSSSPPALGTQLPPEDTFAVRTPPVLILSPRRSERGSAF